MRIVKRDDDAAPVRVLKPGEPGAEDAASLLKYNLLDQFPFGVKKLGELAGLNQYEARAVVHLLGLQAREDCFKEIRVDKVTFKRYSQQALREVRQAVKVRRLQEAKVALREFERQRRGGRT